MRLYSVYCSGSIAKGPDDRRLCWTDAARAEVQVGASADVLFLNPDDPIVDPDNTFALFGRDMYQVMVADAVIVDARERRGIGIGVEMAAAATFGTPVIAVVQRNSYYRRDHLEFLGKSVKDYVHPHVASLASVVVEDFSSAGSALLTVARQAKPGITSAPEWLTAAIRQYRETLLPHDELMRDALGRLDAEARTA